MLQVLLALDAVLRPRLGLTARLRNRITAFVAAVGRGAGPALVGRQMNLQRGLGEIVLFGTAVYNVHIGLLPFLQIEQLVELGGVAERPAAVVLGVSQDVGGSDAAFQ